MPTLCILEWLCGGGMHSVDSASVPRGLRDEGWAMLECLMRDFHLGGNRVSTVLDRRLIDEEQWNELKSISELVTEFDLNLQNNDPQDQGFDRTIAAWIDVARQSDRTIVVAPELDGILKKCIDRLTQGGIKLINCSGDFLRACCDKWLAACCFDANDIPHPRTFLATHFGEKFRFLGGRWCAKPRFGCGCDGLLIAEDATTIGEFLDGGGADGDLIVQEWIEGDAYSCSAIVDSTGNPHWLPLVTQEFESSSASKIRGATLSYLGAKLAPESIQQIKPVALLNKTLEALAGEPTKVDKLPGVLGWVGVDLVLDRENTWTIIEVNARATTSIATLSQHCTTHFARQLTTLTNDQ